MEEARVSHPLARSKIRDGDLLLFRRGHGLLGHLIATAVVTGIEGDFVLARIDKATGKVKSDQNVRAVGSGTTTEPRAPGSAAVFGGPRAGGARELHGGRLQRSQGPAPGPVHLFAPRCQN
ncbi:MAG: hypothetical protein A2V98_14470 [Planctomycetes bacterium RBG_16_64_12]|nr:MAG: hypothetical protein A2V98_14470 [Planctomycetes bacterium RBG_16_64_12]